ncbi:MAG TPA: glycerate kinase [Alphaproteobacteria bacterium]|nr:glycerate kinase [Alphaproteobacteria bacterium]
MAADPRETLRTLFTAAIAAADPAKALPPHLPSPPQGRTVVVGAGKAAATMARAVEDHYQGPLSGLVVTRYGHRVPTRRIEVVEASHPVPDEAGRQGAERILDLVSGLGADDLVLCLISGGGSALLTCPARGIKLADMQALTQALLKSGATISEINVVRKHLSRIAGGRLAAATRARILTLAVSDVPGDDPSAIASGPTAPDPTTLREARGVLAKYSIVPPAPISAHLASAAAETPKPDDPLFDRTEYRIVASPKASLDAAAQLARHNGFTPLILGDAIEGEAREVGHVHATLARDIAAGRGPLGPPAAILSGGETTVTVRGRGRGGRNVEFLLGLVVALDGAPGIYGLAGDTDGIDGTEANAGALAAPDTLARARASGLDPLAMLDDNDAYTLFKTLDDLVVTGPTLTNVNDFRAVLVLASAAA